MRASARISCTVRLMATTIDRRCTPMTAMTDLILRVSTRFRATTGGWLAIIRGSRRESAFGRLHPLEERDLKKTLSAQD